MAVTETTTAQRNIAAAQAATARNGSTPFKLDTPKEIQDRFLTLLIAQLQNQDPLSPMDNAQITQQMAQISTVQGISTLNDTMTQLLSVQGSQAAQFIGRGVTIDGSNLNLSTGVANGSALLAGNANEVQVEILGALFRSSSYQADLTELIVVVTPRLVKATDERPALPTERFNAPSERQLFLEGRIEGAPASAETEATK